MVLALVFRVIWSRVKGPEFAIVVWNWRSVIGLYGVGFVAPKGPQVFVVLRVFSRVFCSVVVVMNLYPLFSLRTSIFLIKTCLKPKIPVFYLHQQ